MGLFNEILSYFGMGQGQSIPVLNKENFSLFFEVDYLIGTVLYIDDKAVGFVVELRSMENYAVLIKVNPFVDEFIRFFDPTNTKAGITKCQVYEKSEFKKSWVVDEIPTLDSFRYFRIQVNSKDF